MQRVRRCRRRVLGRSPRVGGGAVAAGATVALSVPVGVSFAALRSLVIDYIRPNDFAFCIEQEEQQVGILGEEWAISEESYSNV